MFQNNTYSNSVQYPSLSILNQKPITDLPFIQLKVTAKNTVRIVSPLDDPIIKELNKACNAIAMISPAVENKMRILLAK